jgi:hypothetical protein
MTDAAADVRRAPAGQPAMEGPTGEGEATELAGDFDAGSDEAAVQGGAATGAVVGAVLGGPIGMAVGAAAGGAAGGVKGGDPDDRHPVDGDAGVADRHLEATSTSDANEDGGAVAGPDGELRRY